MKTLTIALFSLLSINVIGQTDSVLFLGNSYTSTSNVPNTFKSLANSGGKSVYIDSYTPGGKQLSQHYADQISKDKINDKKWDFVVLQEQSQMPALNPNTTIGYAQAIALDLVKVNNSCTEVVTYMTWAREAGNSWLTQVNWTHDEMATYYEDFYEDIWVNVPGRVSPVGKAFHIATNEGIDVYSSDGSHQNSAGTYLAACVFYATIYKESPIGLSYSTQGASLTTQLQEIAHDVVMTDLYEHNINKVRFNLSTTNLTEGEVVDYLERIWMEPFPNSFIWNFEGGDEASSTQENPSGILYHNNGFYDVTLSIADACGYQESRTYTDTVKVNAPTTAEEMEGKSPISKYYISKASPFLLLSNEFLNSEVKIYDLSGRLIQEASNKTRIDINVKSLSQYVIVEVKIGQKVFKEKVVVIK